MHIPRRFSILIDRIAPTSAEINAYSTHLKTVGNAVEAALQINRTERIGSFSRGSAVRGISDLDLMVVLSSNERKWGGSTTTSSTVLNKIKDALSDRFYSTAIRNSGNAVVLSFAGGRRSVDVVPAFFVRPYQGSAAAYTNYPIFTIPDGAGAWLETSPQVHGAALSHEDQRSGHKLKRVAMLAKYWAALRTNLKLHSFHTEILIASTQISIGPRPYAAILHDLFKHIADRRGQGIRDPLQISGVIPSSTGLAGAERLAAAAVTALDHSARALDAEANRDTSEAIRQWKIVFAGNFPS
jgi:hypothetical protein